MMEIYNEDVFDLFEGVKRNKERTKLKIAENKGMRSFENNKRKHFYRHLKLCPTQISSPIGKLSVIYYVNMCPKKRRNIDYKMC